MGNDELTKCTYCDEPLSKEELENPSRDGDGDILCDECHTEHCQFVCCACANLVDIAGTRDDIGCLLIIVDADELEGMPLPQGPGIYRILEHPYYGGSVLGPAEIEYGAIEWVSPLPPEAAGWNMSYCPAGHVCLECRAKLEAWIQQNQDANKG